MLFGSFHFKCEKITWSSYVNLQGVNHFDGRGFDSCHDVGEQNIVVVEVNHSFDVYLRRNKE
jgi:hypothetical protein